MGQPRRFPCAGRELPGASRQQELPAQPIEEPAIGVFHAYLRPSNSHHRTGRGCDDASGDTSNKELSQSRSAVGSDDEKVSMLQPSRPSDQFGRVAFQKEANDPNACLFGPLCQFPELLFAPPPRLTVEKLPCLRAEVLFRNDRHERHDNVQNGQRCSIGPRHRQSGRKGLTRRLREV